MDRLRAFEVFTTVVTAGGFARAAAILDTSPANVTRYVAELERRLGARLLQRSSRRISLTAAGEAFFERARSILTDVEEAEGAAQASGVAPRGKLRVNAPLSFGVLHLAPIWPRYLAAYPDVELDVSLTDRLVDLVEEGFDLAVRISRSSFPTLVARKLATSRNVICASPHYLAEHGAPQSPSDLAGRPAIIFRPTAMANEWELARGSESVTVRVRPVMSTNNGETARAAAIAGLGLIRQPTFLVADELRAGRLVHVLGDWVLPDIEILAVYPSRRHLSAKVRTLVDFLVAEFRGVPPWERG